MSIETATQQDETAIQHTIPTAEELADQASRRASQLGINRQNKQAFEVVPVENGYAYRPWGSREEVEFQWARGNDLRRECQLFTFADSEYPLQVMSGLAEENLCLQRENTILRDSMGLKSLARFSKACQGTRPKARSRN